MLEQQLERIAKSLEAIAQALNAGVAALPEGKVDDNCHPIPPPASPTKKESKQKPTPTAFVTKPEVAQEQVSVVSISDVTAQLRRYVDMKGEKGHEAGVALLAKYKAKRISELSPANFGSIIADIQKEIGK